MTLNEALTRISELTATVERLSASLEFGCERSPEDCECPGCTLATSYAGDVDRLLADRTVLSTIPPKPKPEDRSKPPSRKDKYICADLTTAYECARAPRGCVQGFDLPATITINIRVLSFGPTHSVVLNIDEHGVLVATAPEPK